MERVHKTVLTKLNSFMAATEHQDQKPLRREGFLLVYSTTSQFIGEGSQGRSLDAATDAER